MKDDGVPDAIRATSVADWLLARGRTSITTNEAAELLGIPAGQVRTRLFEPVRRNELVSPARGLWVPVPPQYRTWGAPPGLHIVDDLMGHLGREYYVGWLSAAEIHGSAHQRPQVFQVAVSRHVADRAVGRTRFDFAVRADLGSLPRRRHEVPTGYAWVASPELVVLDLCADPERAAGLANAADVVAELAADDLVDVVELARVSRSFPAVVGRRAGWMLDLVGPDIETDVLVAAFRDRSTVPGVLRPDLPDRGPIDARWGIRINGEVEHEL